jgi:hypothetical protein
MFVGLVADGRVSMDPNLADALRTEGPVFAAAFADCRRIAAPPEMESLDVTARRRIFRNSVPNS